MVAVGGKRGGVTWMPVGWWFHAGWLLLAGKYISIEPQTVLKRLTGFLVALVLKETARQSIAECRWIFLVLFAATFPGRFMQFRHWQVFGLSHLDGAAWMLLVLKSQLVPLFKFMAANLLIFCFMGMLPRRWWMAAAGMLFLLFHLLPELTGLTRPLDPVEETVPMEAGPTGKPWNRWRRKRSAPAASWSRTRAGVPRS